MDNLTSVCADCFSDYALQNLIQNNLTEHECSFCGKKRQSLIAADLELVEKHFIRCLKYDWDRPENCLYYDSREGGWQTGGFCEVYDGYDLAMYEFDCFNNFKLTKYFADCLSESQFIPAHFTRMDANEVYRASWDLFSHTVKHRRRFVWGQYRDKLFDDESEREIIEPAEFVGYLSRLINNQSLVRTIPSGTIFHRARVHEASFDCSLDKDLSTCPTEKANTSNRMSPAGIPMFYAALDRETAVSEVVQIETKHIAGKKVTIGEFENLRSLKIIDFTNIPSIPSLFDDEKRDLRNDITTLQEFIKDLSTPIVKDGREHIEYVPTQIVTEYLRDIFKYQNQGIDGLYYPSAQNGKVACVLFVSSQQCFDNKNESQILKLVRTQKV